jgi:hypothetical protein
MAKRMVTNPYSSVFLREQPPGAVLKLAFGNKKTDAVSLDKTAVENLVSVLKAIVPYFDAIEATSMRVVDARTAAPRLGRIILTAA